MGVTKTCWDATRCKCEVHGRACSVGLEFDDGRAISIYAAEAVPEVAKYLKHTEDSVHSCDWCSLERQENREPGYYQAHPKTGKRVPRAVIEKEEREARKAEERKAKRKRKRWGRKNAEEE